MAGRKERPVGQPNCLGGLAFVITGQHVVHGLDVLEDGQSQGSDVRRATFLAHRSEKLSGALELARVVQVDRDEQLGGELRVHVLDRIGKLEGARRPRRDLGVMRLPEHDRHEHARGESRQPRRPP